MTSSTEISLCKNSTYAIVTRANNETYSQQITTTSTGLIERYTTTQGGAFGQGLIWFRNGYGGSIFAGVNLPGTLTLVSYTLMGSCNGDPEGATYDFINGRCVLSTTYNTGGKYSSLSACQSEGLTDAINLSPNNPCNTPNQVVCQSPNICIDPTNFCPPGEKCIDLNEWSQIESLSNQIKNRSCQ
jgi:hypothetical protein